MKETKQIIQYMQDCDSPANGTEHSNVTDMDLEFRQPAARPEIATYARSSNTYSTQARTTATATHADDRWASDGGGSSASTATTSTIAGTSSNNSNNLFNKVYHSGR